MSVDLWIERVGARAKVDLGPPSRRRRLVALRRRSVGSARTGERHQACAAARRGSRRSAPCRGLDAAAGRTRQAARLFPRRRTRQHAVFAAPPAAFLAGAPLEAPEPQPLPRLAGYLPGEGAVSLERLVRSVAASREGEAAFEQRSFECDGDAAAALHLPLEGGGRPLQRPGGGDSRVANEAQHARHRFYPAPDRPAPHREGATGTPPGRSDPPPSGEGVTALDGQPPSAERLKPPSTSGRPRVTAVPQPRFTSPWRGEVGRFSGRVGVAAARQTRRSRRGTAPAVWCWSSSTGRCCWRGYCRHRYALRRARGARTYTRAPRGDEPQGAGCRGIRARRDRSGSCRPSS